MNEISTFIATNPWSSFGIFLILWTFAKNFMSIKVFKDKGAYYESSD